MSTAAPSPTQYPQRLAIYVRVTQAEYEQLAKDQLVIGKSLPVLLRERYFKGNPVQPVFDSGSTKEILRQLSHYGRNLNQLTRYFHSGMAQSVINDFQSHCRLATGLLVRISEAYGNGKDSL